MTRTERFLQLHRELETELRKQLRLSNNISYYVLLEKSIESGDKTTRQNEDFLRSLGNFRNIVSHVSYGPDHIAELSPDALEKFEVIVKRITQPVLVRDVASKTVRVFEETDTLLMALDDMKKNDYSQIIVRRGGKLGLVGPEGLTHWMLRESGSVGLLEPASTFIGDVGLHEPRTSCRFMKPNQTVDEARAAFLDGISNPSTRLYAIIITHSAKATEVPLGIVTPSDVFGY